MKEMTTFELDLSKSDSFIDGIQEIFKPPSVESSNNVRITKGYMKSLNSSTSNDVCMKDTTNMDDYEHRSSIKAINISWKKPKPNAHEYCDSCGTFEGERLVCDRCPASFHLECLDPPIEIDEAPVSVWYCNRCTAIMKYEEDKQSSGSENSHNKGDGEGGNVAVSNGCNSNNGNAKRSARSTSSGSSEITTEMLAEEVPMKKIKLSEHDTNIIHITALQNIQDVVKCINPKEFELPKNLIPGIKLPFTYKTQVEMKTKSVISLENGIIPRPLVTCFECTRTCFYGSLIQCDYCPLYFHLDCLDPPLVQLPSRVERWMCPNHIEQVIDNSGIIKTIRLSERMNAYEEIHKQISNIDEVDLLINFGLGRGFRFGSKIEEIVKEKPKVEVPDAVKRMYKTPLMTQAQNGQTCDQRQSTLNDQQKRVLQSILRGSRSDIEVSNMDPLTLLHMTLDSINGLDLLPGPPSKPLATSRPGAEQVKSRALLIPISSNQNTENLPPPPPPTRMIYRNFDIGSSIDNDCVVTGCRYVSPRHASISYIDNHFCFELVNYSRYGTVVDDLFYYNDVSDKDSHHSCQPNQNIKDIRAFIDSTGAMSSAASHKTTALNSMRCQRDSDKPSERCMCAEYGYTNNGLNDCTDHGWENTATLRFGSVIRIGCQQFVFAEMSPNVSVTDGVGSVSDPVAQFAPLSSLSSSSSSSSSHKSSLSGHSKSKSPPNVQTEPQIRSSGECVTVTDETAAIIVVGPEDKVSNRRLSDESMSCELETEVGELSSEETTVVALGDNSATSVTQTQ